MATTNYAIQTSDGYHWFTEDTDLTHAEAIAKCAEIRKEIEEDESGADDVRVVEMTPLQSDDADAMIIAWGDHAAQYEVPEPTKED